MTRRLVRAASARGALALFIAVGVSLLCAAGAAAASAPTVTTGAATGVGTNSATANGSVNPQGLPATAYFQYGTSSSYGSQSSTQTLSGNLVPNPSFETGTTSGWSIGGSVTPKTFQAQTGWATQGSYSARFTTGTISSSGYSEVDVNPYIKGITAGAQYTVSADLNVLGLSSKQHVLLYVTWRNSSGSGLGKVQAGSTSSLGTRTLSATLTAPSNATQAQVDVTVEGGGVADLYYDNVELAGGGSSSTQALSSLLSSLGPGTTYHYRLVASSSAGTSFGADQTFTTGTPDTTAPSVPAGLSATPGNQQVSLSWSPSSDPDSAVAGYQVFRNGSQVATVAGTSYTDSGLTNGTSYTYDVKAYDPSGNVSAASATVSSTPQASSGSGPAAGDLYVSASAPAGGDGSAAAPFQTISACAAALTAGHTCWIENGTYSDMNVCPANSGTSDTNRVTFAAYPGDTPVIDGAGRAGSAFDCWQTNYLTIRGLTIENFVAQPISGYSEGGAIVILHALYPVVEDNTIHDISSDNGAGLGGIWITGGYNSTPSPVTIANNLVYNVTGPANDTYDIWPNGDYFSSEQIIGNITYNSSKDGIRAECDTNSQNMTIEDNISVHNVNDGIDVNDCYASGQVLVRNNFVGWNGAQDLQAKHTDHVTFIDNTSYQSGYAGTMDNGDSPEGSTGNYGTVYGANWHLAFRDNIFDGQQYGGNLTSGAYALNPSFDYDLYSGSTNGLWWIDGVGGFTTLSSLQNSTGFETHGIVADPQFVSPSTGNFTLGSSSPAVGKSSTGGSIGADPTQLAGAGPQHNYGLANIPLV